MTRLFEKWAMDPALVLAILGVLSSVIAAYYYLRIVKVMYFDEPSEAMDKGDGEVRAVQVIAALLVLFFFLFPTPLTRLADVAVRSLTG